MTKPRRLLLLGGLVLLALPSILLGFFSYHEMIDKQELQLRRGYEHSAEYIRHGLDNAIHEMKHHLIFVGKNPVLQNILTGQVKDPTEIPFLLTGSIEPYLWYHSTSNRSLMKKIVIYAERPLSVGVFLRPLKDIVNKMPDDFARRDGAASLLFIDGELCYAYRFSASSGSAPLGVIVGWLDVDKLVDLNIREERDIGFTLSYEGTMLFESRGINRERSLTVTSTSDTTGLSLSLIIPAENIKLETGAILRATIISLVIFLATYLVLMWSIGHLVRQVELERERREQMRLKALQAQINPHFLYNTLSMINWKAKHANVPDISLITTLIADFYRTALNKGQDTIRLSEELKNVASYLSLKRIMMDDCFDFDIVCDDALGQHHIVNFILQPLVENAVIHGIAPQGKGHITITTRDEGTDIVISVHDDGVGMAAGQELLPSDQAGYGITNINERIRLLCGKDYGVAVVPCDTGTQVDVRVKKLSP